jgi:hypothetical protein
MEFKDDNTIINTLNMKFLEFLNERMKSLITVYNTWLKLFGFVAPNMRNHTTHNSYENLVYVTM